MKNLILLCCWVSISLQLALALKAGVNIQYPQGRGRCHRPALIHNHVVHPRITRARACFCLFSIITSICKTSSSNVFPWSNCMNFTTRHTSIGQKVINRLNPCNDVVSWHLQLLSVNTYFPAMLLRMIVPYISASNFAHILRRTYRCAKMSTDSTVNYMTPKK